MLFLVDCKLSGEKCKYIYAACTYKNQRGKGYMSNLLEYCQENYDLLSLIPADNSLVRFYNKCAFTYREDIVNIYFDESEDIEEYLFDGCNLVKPFYWFTEKRRKSNGLFIFSKRF